MRERTVHLLRHGEVYNPDRVLYGRLPGFRLSERGVEQAQQAAAFLAERDIGYVVASPLERARETAQPLADRLGLAVEIDERLIEAENHLQGKQVAGTGNSKRLFADPSNWKYEAVCVSHQLPIVAARRFVEGKRLAHDPRKRQCALASVTSFTFIDDVVVRVGYAEPAGATPSGAVAGA